MDKSKIVSRCALLAGILLIIAAMARAISINNLVIAASTGDINEKYAASVIVDWSFSSTLLLLIAIWILFLLKELGKLQRRAWLQGTLIGTALLLFGGGFMLKYPSSLHLLFFSFTGLLLLLPLLLYSRHFK